MWFFETMAANCVASVHVVALTAGLALLAAIAGALAGWLAGQPPASNGWETIRRQGPQRRPAGWAHRLAQACAATLPLRMVAKAQARAKRQLAALRKQARAAAREAIEARGRHPAIGPVVPMAAPAWPPRPHARRASGTWLVWGDWATPLADGAWA